MHQIVTPFVCACNHPSFASLSDREFHHCARSPGIGGTFGFLIESHKHTGELRDDAVLPEWAT